MDLDGHEPDRGMEGRGLGGPTASAAVTPSLQPFPENMGGILRGLPHNLPALLEAAWQHEYFRVAVAAGLVGIVVAVSGYISPWLPVAAVAGIFLLIATLSKPIILAYLMIAAIALLSGTQRGRLIPMLAPNEAMLLLSVYVVLLVTLANKQRSFRISGYFVWAFVTLVGGTVIIPIVVYLYEGVDLNFSNAFKMVAPIQYFLLFWVFASLPRNEDDRRRIVFWMLGCGAVVALVGILQALRVGFILSLLQNWYASPHETVAANAGRVTSLLGAWNSLGMLMMVEVLVCWAILPEMKAPRARAFLIVVMGLAAICLVATGSYAGILGVIMGIPLIEVIAKRKSRNISVLFFTSLAIVIALVLLQPILQPLIEKRLADQYSYGGIAPRSLVYRIMVWQKIFIPAILQHFPWPVYPIVPSNYAWGYEESEYILLFFRTGLSGFLGHLAWVGITVGWLLQNRRKKSDLIRLLSVVAAAIILVLSIAGFTNEVFSFAGSADYIWITLALVSCDDRLAV